MILRHILFTLFNAVIVALATATRVTAFANEIPLTSFYAEERLADGKLFLKETYELKHNAQAMVSDSTVTYRDEAGQIVATLMAHFANSARLPDLEFLDHRDGYAYASKFDAKKNEIYSWVQENPKLKKQEQVLSADENVYTLVSLDIFVKKHWDELVAKKTLDVRIFSPSRQDIFSATIAATDSMNDTTHDSMKDSMNDSAKDLETLKVKIRMGSFLVRQFVPESFITFQKTERNQIRLLKYNGNSNILDDKDRAQKVTTTYFY